MIIICLTQLTGAALFLFFSSAYLNFYGLVASRFIMGLSGKLVFITQFLALKEVLTIKGSIATGLAIALFINGLFDSLA